MADPVIERRQNFLDEAKLSTQRNVTYLILLIFAGVVVAVFLKNDPAERSSTMQIVYNVAMLAIGFWLGSSKSSTDKDASISRIAEASAPAVAAAVAATNSAPIKTDEVKIEAATATVTETPKSPAPQPQGVKP